MQTNIVKKLFLLLVLLLITFAFASCDEDEYHIPRECTIIFNKGNGESPDVVVFREEFPDIQWVELPEREGYDFVGYYDEEHDDYFYYERGGYYDNRHDGTCYFGPGGRWSTELYYLVRTSEEVDKVTRNLYAHYRPEMYNLVYSRGDADTLQQYDAVYYSDISGIPIHIDRFFEDGITANLDKHFFVGWYAADGTRVYDSLGMPLLSTRELYSLAGRLNDGKEYWEADPIVLTPRFEPAQYTVTYCFGDGMPENLGIKEYVDTEFSKLSYPATVYHNGSYLVGWSTSPDELIPPEGAVSGDITLYAIWTPAKRVRAVVEGTTRDAYIFPDGSIKITDPPDVSGDFGVTGSFSDFEHKSPISLGAVAEGSTVYLEWGRIVKRVYLYPNNGDSPYLVTFHFDPTKDEIELPAFGGHKIAGFYSDSSLEGEAVRFSFDGVTDGASYYIKWESE